MKQLPKICSHTITPEKSGHPIPENDIWIAASCTELDAPIVSRDSHFKFIDNLRIISWESE